MAVSETQKANDRYREELIKKLMDFCCAEDIGGSSDWVRRTNTNAFAFLFVNDNNDEGTVKITISFPKGSRDGEPYDYDAEADEYAAKIKRKEENAKKAAELKAKKIEADKKKREVLKKQKEKREEKGE